MNELIEYGIFQEKSDIRAHVGPLAKTIYCYRTEEMRCMVESGEYKLVTASQPDFDGITAEGWPVPISDIEGLIPVRWFSCPLWPEFGEKQHHLNPTQKGELACEIVQRLLRTGRFPLWVAPDECKEIKMQIEGTDVFVNGKWKIQTKCDWLAAPKENGGSGNLFIQCSECNPHNLH